MKHLEVFVQGLSTQPSGGAYVLNCIYAEIIIYYDRDIDPNPLDILIDGVRLIDWAPRQNADKIPNIIRRVLPVVYDVDGTPIPYKHRMTASPINGWNGAGLSGTIMQVRLANQ